MGFIISYRTLCTLNIYHHFFLNRGERSENPPWTFEENFAEMDKPERDKKLSRYRAFDILKIEPTPSCLKTLNNHAMILKYTSTGVVIACKAEGNKPWIPFGQDLKLTFLLQTADPFFHNYSDLSLKKNGQPSIYYFNNLIQDTTYQIGLSPVDIKQGPLDYIDQNTDKILKVYPNLYNYVFDQQYAGIIATLELFDQVSGKLIFSKEVEPTPDTLVQQLDLRRFPSAWYLLKAREGNNVISEEEFYLNNDGLTSQTFSVVELYGFNDANDHALLESTGELKPEENLVPGNLQPARFELRFKNRATIWKYLNSVDGTEMYNTSDSGNEGKIPLTASGYVEILLQNPVRKLPNPDASMVVPDEDPVSDDVYSVIYL